MHLHLLTAESLNQFCVSLSKEQCLTKILMWNTVDSIRNKASRVKCRNTPHNSNPTLFQPVNGLRGIIHDRGTCVLRGISSPFNGFIEWGCFGFLVWKARRLPCANE
jgi:hypothetical protein